ncbi:hypothetical protein ACFPYI_04710 [Halomarina salina]|uniref:DUF2240 family protein n=1 Tax=Halomarina salina TaxID=1872699 RepID=A0ABD5RJ70_9EURY|nr:hypothetical protein [Halomarina salina]
MSDGGGPDDSSSDEASDDDTLAVDADDLAGVVDLFGALTAAELRKALGELAFKRDVPEPPDSLVDDAVASYHLVEHDGLLVVGPAAFPTLPEGAADLPHILDVDREAPATDAVAQTAERRFREEAGRTLERESPDPSAVERLVDVSYDLEAWGPVDVGEVRERLVAAESDLTDSTDATEG